MLKEGAWIKINETKPRRPWPIYEIAGERG
jgi:hypothetical protein